MSESELLKLNPSIWHPEELELLPEGSILIPMKRIRPPKDAIREKFEPLYSLKGSIRRRGLLQPLGVRPLDPEWKEFEPVIGCRRYFACSELKLEKVPCYIKLLLKTDDIAAIALEENTFRKNLTRRETVKAISILVKEGHSEGDIANIAGMAPQYARAYIKLPSMSQRIRTAFYNKKIAVGHIIILSELNNDGASELFKRIESENLSVASVTQIMRFRQHFRRHRGIPYMRPNSVSKKVWSLIGRNLFLGEGGKGIYLKISAESKRELRQILCSVFKSIDGLCVLPWHGKLGRKSKEEVLGEGERK